MWKDVYAVGNEVIDEQHQELFRMTDDLVETIRRQGPDSASACAQAVTFLKNYVVKHFADEEALQASLGYAGLEAHKVLHRDFVATVLEYEKNLVESNFGSEIMQQFGGTLIGWLIYHVVGEDCKITGMVKTKAPQVQEKVQPDQFIVNFADSACEVLSQMLNLTVQTDPNAPPPGGQVSDLNVSIGIVGDHKGSAEFSFPLVTALRLVQHMTMTDPSGLSGIMESALREIANIISGNAASRIAEAGYVCDITPPKMYRGQHPLLAKYAVVKCDLGPLVVSVS
jgi:hemerythrin